MESSSRTPNIKTTLLTLGTILLISTTTGKLFDTLNKKRVRHKTEKSIISRCSLLSGTLQETSSLDSLKILRQEAATAYQQEYLMIYDELGLTNEEVQKREKEHMLQEKRDTIQCLDLAISELSHID